MAYLRSVDMPFLLLQFTSNFFLWLLACMLLGTAYAFLMYNRSILKSPLNRLLFFLRLIVVTAIAFLLVAPMLRFMGSISEKPLIILAQDNSSSIWISKPAGFDTSAYNRDLKDLVKTLSADYEVRSMTFGSAIVPELNPQYSEPITNISSVFKYVSDQYANRNIGAVILVSDGIYNQGGNPEYAAQNLKSPVFTVALGDTIAKKDLLISNVNYNNIVYLGNDFEVNISVSAFQSRGARTILTVSDASGALFSKSLSIESNEMNLSVPVILPAKRKGIQRYTISLSSVPGELSIENNKQSFYVEVIDGKKKVLVLANSPHPDIAAIRSSLAINKNYEFKTKLFSDYRQADLEGAGLIIMHQLPSAQADISTILRQSGSIPIWYILGAQTNISQFSTIQNLLTINSAGSTEETTASVNADFYEFTISEATRNSLQKFAPLISPFGTYAVKSQASVLLNQQIGRLATDKPLLAFSKTEGKKLAVLAGEGLWKWRLQDFEETGTHNAVDELITKTIQLLVSQDDKRKFRVYTSKNTFDESEHVVLNAELYNNNYELLNSPDVSLSLKNTSLNKSYSFLFTRSGNSYILDAGILPPGEYSYVANTTLGSTKLSQKGEFVIMKTQAEYRQTTANHQLLHNLANLNNGDLVYPRSLNELPGMLKKNELIKTISYENNRYEELINFKLIFFLIVTLLSLEWIIRKRNGKA